MKHITSKLLCQRHTRGEIAPYDLGKPFGYGDKPLFINYGNTSLKAYYQKLIVKWEE